ncbi:hypothetical protein D3C78_56770 [compost metagenome]
MIIVLIHWRIKPTSEAEAAFFEFWKNQAKILDKTQLIGEFLSAPMPATDFPFKVDDLSESHSNGMCKHFINVGVWKSWNGFNEQVGRYMNDSNPMLEFEAERRTRTVLDPRHWRIGNSHLPIESTCE